MRDDGKLHNIETEKKLFTTDHPGWKKTANKMVESGIGVDFFIGAAGGGYMDIATIGRHYGIKCASKALVIDNGNRTRICRHWRRDVFLP